MADSKTLETDPVHCDVNLAIEYFEKKKYNIMPIAYNELVMTNYYIVDANGLQLRVYIKSYLDNLPKPKFIQQRSDTILCLRKLRKLIDSNEQLFSQIQLKTRKIPIRETIDQDLQLIKQNLDYYSSFTDSELDLGEKDQIFTFIVGRDTPFACIGLIAQLVLHYDCVKILAATDVAASYELFAKLCHTAGLYQIEQHYEAASSSTPSAKNLDADKLRDMFDTGCTSIVTESADIDSTVQLLLDSPTQYPWALRRVYAQENVYEDFKSSISWKTNLQKNSSQIKLDDSTIKASSNIYHYNNKVFLCDFVGTIKENNGGQIILVEAFRTVKELLSLLGSPFCLNISASDIAMANEIAFRTKTQIVWINNYGNFKGPAKVSQSFYSQLDTIINKSIIESIEILDIKWSKGNSWVQKDATERRELAINATEKLGGKLKSVVQNIIDNKSSFADVQSEFSCMGLPISAGVIMLPKDTNEKYTAEALSSTVFGNVIVYNGDNNDIKQLAEKLPIITTNVELPYNLSAFYKTKVIWSSYGTIFAN